jgi:hypothetical protein
MEKWKGISVKVLGVSLAMLIISGFFINSWAGSKKGQQTINQEMQNFKQGIGQSQSDKNHMLKKLKEHNEISEGMADYAKEMAGKAEALKNRNSPLNRKVPRRVNKSTQRFSPAGDRETLRNKRKKASSQFEKAQQKSDRSFKDAASTLKAINENRKGLTKNIK